ncbi:SDR family oxidoreductase [Planococcus sp. CP5-4]|uniref:SDR family oxidoreductase n=1 Tax=unclassified Planococcus (in: firmicutes) TaxID=2662419 RepID=UPI001C214FD7|nr:MULTISPECIES: SDR family oxidoreductase [unclassified Planococcus (in: firmicutes)]MBU9674764.1 SDR family oxidoreductase [Planococcus sp. CP5-4_YE]MBV0908860.1 SDR family oxidoreductase [Planococcus sp. CP5-4_UN]MBW6063909.1 SDR family oxidoreductase [Planococcus sp. CP5-4]
MKILILGGTRFLGRFLTESALKRGHEVTLFNRGKENPELFPEVEKLIGDRGGDLSALKDGEWDAVIDTCGFVPHVVRESAKILAKRTGHYTFISSASVYDELESPGIREEHPVGQMSMSDAEEMTEGMTNLPNNEYYGELKFLCEQEVEQQFTGHSLIVRPGLIVGPYDFTGRFSYWINRVAKGGQVLAPGRKDKRIQFIDVRDLAEWIIHLVEQQQSGVFNAVGPQSPLTMEAFLGECQKVLKSDAEIVWIDEAFLLENDVGYWMELPLWIPDSERMEGFLSLDIDKALGKGLSFRPLSETILDTHKWELGNKALERKAGLACDKEQVVLKKWKNQ